MKSSRTQDDELLSSRDIVWLQRLSNGETMKELYPSSPQYAKNLMREVRFRLGVKTTAEAIIYAFRKGLIK